MDKCLSVPSGVSMTSRGLTQLGSLCPGHSLQRGHELKRQAAVKGGPSLGVRCSTGQAQTRGPPQFLTGIRDIALSGKYETWILDQFGVLHDGKKAYPEAISTLQSLARLDVKLILLSNSSRPSEVTRRKLPSLGFDPSLFHAIITSGELTQRSLLKRDDPWFQSLGTKCLHMTWTTRGGVTLEGLGLDVVESVDEAEFLLAHGTEGIASPDGSVQAASMEELEAVLRQAAELSRARGQALPLIIANPDFVTVEERALRVMPGTLGKLYAEMGGEVKCMGKPDPIVFQESCMLTGVQPERAIMVGDSLHHDIIGANQVGMDSLFVCGGVHASDLDIVSIGDLPQPAELESLCEREGIWPTYVSGMFHW